MSRSTTAIERLLSIAVCVLCTNVAFGQTAEPKVPLIYAKAAAVYEQDASTYVQEGVYAATWRLIDEGQIVWKKRVWRTIDLNDPGNMVFRTSAQGASLVEIIMSGLIGGQYKGYSAADDRFTEELTESEIVQMTIPIGTGKAARVDPAAITKLRIKEDWLYLMGDKLVVRIVGIAPVIEVKAVDGATKEQAAFWIYYPSIRKYFASQQITGSMDPAVGNLDQAFEGRRFTSTIDNVAAYPMEQRIIIREEPSPKR